ncbi:uncharacterized protein E5676_scaffold901G00150 [Cucumis melo var. makuwa]|uniref:Retrotransposon Copia-like N-terminal domain-containing protein n=1 Tax=Cucumis melo var. makuwa TaxID=1194695 RepID=A0A5D3DU33_CUCMM|nr:uncharacterized protein E5676_scaffold901G00150 [Cucumis melo var. makuwa]
MVLERDIEHTLGTQENTTNDGNQKKETIDSFIAAIAATVDARMSAAMDEWFRRLQKTSKNSFPSNLQLSARLTTPYAPPHATYASVLPTAYHFSGDKLNDNNYFSWSQSVKMVLKGRCKFGFLTEEIPRPPPGDP